MEEEIVFRGHENIQALHRTTLEVTKDRELSLRGDCIIGVNANKACYDLQDRFKELLKKGYMLNISIIVDDYEYRFEAYGSKDLILSHKHDIVIRKSDYICTRTLAIKSSKASIDIPRSIINRLKDPNTKGILLLRIE